MVQYVPSNGNCFGSVGGVVFTRIIAISIHIYTYINVFQAIFESRGKNDVAIMLKVAAIAFEDWVHDKKE